MPVEFKDYYQILGIASNANATEIKKAFRGLARKYHPDVAKNKSAAELKFREINEANEVLSDPDKRRKYDEMREDRSHPKYRANQRRQGFGRRAEQEPEFHFEGTGFSDFFEQFFSSRGQSTDGFGQMWEPNPGARTTAQHGQDVEGDILVTLDEVLHGAERTIKLQRINPSQGASAYQTLRVKIPAGVTESQLIRLAGKGRDGVGGGNAGNLYLRVKFAAHPDFRVRGNHLYCDLNLAPWEATLGASIRIHTLDGIVSLKIPPGTPNGRNIRLGGKGLLNSNGKRGDLHAVVTIQVPSVLTSDEKKLWEKLAATSSFNPRKSI